MKHGVRTGIFVLIVCVSIFLLGTLLSLNNTKEETPARFNIGGEVVTLEIADTTHSREVGLSGRTELGKREGMLFVFEHPDIYGFWMKGMLFSLDIVWLDKAFNVVYLERGLTPESYPEIFTPNKKALYVLEVPAGVSQELGIVQGTKLEPLFE